MNSLDLPFEATDSRSNLPARTPRFRTASALRAWAIPALALLTLGPAANQAAVAQSASPVKKDAHVSAQLFINLEAAQPGATLQAAVVLTPERNWHIYWKNPGGLSGMPTEFRWRIPDGASVGQTLYPVPRLKHDKLLNEDSYILEGESIFLTPVKVPESAAVGSKFPITVNASWLACKKECIPGEVELAVALPVIAHTEPAKPANEAVFKKATGSFPEPLTKAEFVKIGGRVDKTPVRPGDTAAAAIVLDIAAKHHMQSNKPTSEDFIPTVFFVERTEGLEFGEIKYPRAHLREDKFLGKLSEYGGKVEIRIPFTVAEDIDAAPKALRGVLQYQICNDAGTCFPPQYIEVSIPVQVEGGAKAGASADVPTPPPSVEAPEAPRPAEPVAGAPAAPSAGVDGGVLDRVQQWFIARGFIGVIILAALGGMILNLMPCVLPVISLKILSFVRQAHEDRARIFLLGLAYCAGILTFFGVIAYLFATSGRGWGEHFQNPVVILVLAGLVTAFALSLFGVFAVFTPQVVNKLGEKAEAREGLPSAFFTGVLATILGTACTAPFLSAAVGAASRFPAAQGAWIFMAVGVGMALPFLVLAANPAWLRFVPRPGPWMGVFEALMGFLLLGTVIWLLYPISGQLGDWGLFLTLIYLLGVSIAAWIKGRIKWGDPPARRLALHVAVVAMLALAWLVPFRWISTIEKLETGHRDRARLLALAEQARLTGPSTGAVTWDPAVWEEKNGEIPWVPYDEALVRRFVEAGYTVFVDFTADWCASCKANLKSSIDIENTRKLLRELGVVPFEADYTRQDPELKRVLAGHGRAGVPLYLVYSPGQAASPQVLPELLTPGIVEEALRKAGPSKPASRLASAPSTPAPRSATP